ncbi:conserved hypothetical protein [Xenorhabdus nematophila F1]|uniref:Uncharacterized protein n=1 Tax=Xenorhabdus nematophila (strain ATCC 19061 / DSM 3370 / CCUG 14189 / LMG 1036 / NCIMB 9965 / AN6) TaxID=406817 RepID=D3V8X5_XENNA|nr:hypothetical protein LH67_09355 [Xenorhabdus nematophila]CBJ89173.1 hypothetical protein XNC1_1102 [Xenorhabdus nematophila ATCC 19061]CCW31215.1 conserved hypothetical protein [Xenorhabdus nematophila F1]CEE94071.1 hypothetical protein XNA1_450014 [Xenorhabdus nematophila str. Anatoliense]CEF30812.1 hypothetical protein XNW1_2850039 [Xenorhabdus nematophila str. Websteri]CEK22079.1 hypothetical protein XNC2_1083 [Xenorhabdus nematophila AN6/1]
MPLQVVTLEPLVQGERSVASIRLLGLAKHAHKKQSTTFYRDEISAQGTYLLTNTSEKFFAA